MMAEGAPVDCSCKKCVSACRQTPGWFAPGEAEKLAEAAGVEFESYAKHFLIKDHCSLPNAENAPYVWAPKRDIDGEYRIKPHHLQPQLGTCVFLKNDRCAIHALKPFECRKTLVCERTPGVRDQVEQMYRDAGYPLGKRPEAE